MYLYVDEFQDFSGSSFGKILSQARKFNLGLTLANQFPKQVGDLMEDIRGCVTSYVLFQMDQDHANVLKGVIHPYKPQDLATMPQFKALYHAHDGTSQFITTPMWPAPPTPEQSARAERIRQRTIRDYGREPRQEPPSDARLVDEHPDPPRPPSSNRQPPPGKRPFSRPRNPK
jgi:hypothetical protein